MIFILACIEISVGCDIYICIKQIKDIVKGIKKQIGKLLALTLSIGGLNLRLPLVLNAGREEGLGKGYAKTFKG